MARENAYMILNQYFEDESFLNIALNEQLKKSNLKREDKDLCTTIVYGTIQNLLYIQYQLQPYIKGKRVKKKIRTLLYMSLYQLIYLDKIPEYAVINEAVNIAKKQGYQTSKFVNAVLRNFVRNERRSLEGLDELERISRDIRRINIEQIQLIKVKFNIQIKREDAVVNIFEQIERSYK